MPSGKNSYGCKWMRFTEQQAFLRPKSPPSKCPPSHNHLTTRGGIQRYKSANGVNGECAFAEHSCSCLPFTSQKIDWGSSGRKKPPPSSPTFAYFVLFCQVLCYFYHARFTATVAAPTLTAESKQWLEQTRLFMESELLSNLRCGRH